MSEQAARQRAESLASLARLSLEGGHPDEGSLTDTPEQIAAMKRAGEQAESQSEVDPGLLPDDFRAVKVT